MKKKKHFKTLHLPFRERFNQQAHVVPLFRQILRSKLVQLLDHDVQRRSGHLAHEGGYRGAAAGGGDNRCGPVYVADASAGFV